MIYQTKKTARMKIKSIEPLVGYIDAYEAKWLAISQVVSTKTRLPRWYLIVIYE